MNIHEQLKYFILIIYFILKNTIEKTKYINFLFVQIFKNILFIYIIYKMSSDNQEVETVQEQTNESEKRNRSFKVKLSFDGDSYGRYNGDSPYQAANKALSEIIRTKVKAKESTDDKIVFWLIESTKGSAKRIHKYEGERIKLAEPVKYKVGDNEIVKEYKNILKKIKKSEQEEKVVTKKAKKATKKVAKKGTKKVTKKTVKRTKKEVLQAVVSEPVVSEPVVSESVVSEPVVSESIVVESVPKKVGKSKKSTKI